MTTRMCRFSVFLAIKKRMPHSSKSHKMDSCAKTGFNSNVLVYAFITH